MESTGLGDKRNAPPQTIPIGEDARGHTHERQGEICGQRQKKIVAIVKVEGHREKSNQE